MREIYYTDERDGEFWINGSTSYDLKQWTKEEAIADYQSEEAELQDKLDFMRAYGFFD